VMSGVEGASSTLMSVYRHVPHLFAVYKRVGLRPLSHFTAGIHAQTSRWLYGAKWDAVTVQPALNSMHLRLAEPQAHAVS